MRLTRRRFAHALLGAALMIGGSVPIAPSLVAAADYYDLRYTLPFFDHTNFVTQGWSYPGHVAIDYSLGYESVASARGGTVADILESRPDNAICSTLPEVPGNFVLIRHDDGQYTLYLHLQQNSVSVAVGQRISAGRQIATSGNSGKTCNPHLHYGLFANSGWTSAANALNPAGHWTTADAGRVPWRATYVQESHPAGHTLLQYTTTTHWVDFRNVGGRPWRHQDDIFAARGRVFLAQVTDTGSPEENSVFYLSTDWVNQWQPGLADVSAINPDGIGRWTFKLYGRNQGSFTEDFNLVANGLRFFDYASIGHFYIPITVTHCC